MLAASAVLVLHAGYIASEGAPFQSGAGVLTPVQERLLLMGVRLYAGL